MAYGRHFEKTVKLPYLSNRLIDFDEIWHGDANRAPTGDRPLKYGLPDHRNQQPTTEGRSVLHVHKFKRKKIKKNKYKCKKVNS